VGLFIITKVFTSGHEPGESDLDHYLGVDETAVAAAIGEEGP
jgi:hypothetical protein